MDVTIGAALTAALYRWWDQFRRIGMVVWELVKGTLVRKGA
jgi:hypothetical protein